MEWRQEQGRCPGDVNLETGRTWTLWQTEVERRMSAQFARREVRWRAGASIRGLLSPVERKNGWQLAEVHGETTPDGVQHVLGRAMWEAEALRDAVRPYVVEPLGALAAVLGVDETGCLTQGQHAAGVARHDSGTAGRVDNGPIGVCLTSARPRGHVLLDRELDLPKAWPSDEARGAGAGIPAERTLATKPPCAQQMLERAFDAHVPASWVAGDSVYGENRALRAWLEAHNHADVLAVSGKAYLWQAGQHHQVKTLLATLAPAGWDRLRAGDGTKGPRWDDGRWRALAAPRQIHWRRWLLVRRSLHDPTALTVYVVFAPHATVLETVVQVAGNRWTMEQCFAEAKGEGGLDQDEVRSWTAWYRPITWAMWAYALLTVLRAAHLPAAPPLKKI